MRRDWEGRTVVITGSTRGIGQATAEVFGRDGAHVVVHGRDQAAGAEVVRRIRSAGGDADFVAVDLRADEAGHELAVFALEVSGRLDVLVNNAGANVFVGALRAAPEDWDTCMRLDLRAVWRCSAAAAAVMSRPGAIVNVSSNHAYSTLPGAFPYNVAKAGVLALTQSLAIELAERRIRVNTVCPGYIDTPINDAYFEAFPDPAAERVRVEALHPLGRIGLPEEVAYAIRFLASDEHSGFTTGTHLLIDGGRSTLMQDPAPVPPAG